MSETARVALVTGGGRGIGRAVALALGRAGYTVAVAARDLDALEGVRRELEDLGATAAAVRLDVTDSASILRAVPAVAARLGDPSVVVNNAGVSSSAPFLKLDRAQWEHTMAVNATGPFLVTQACLPAMLEQGWGRIVNVASTAAVEGFKYTAHYTASKHALLGMTRALAAEVASKGITVNCVCPGFVDTDMTARSVADIVDATGMTPEQARRALEKQSRQKRLITPQEVAAAVVYLASDGARGVNGEALLVNG